MLKSGLPRLVVRKTNMRLVCQVVEYLEKGDKTLVHVDSNQLKKYGWTHGLKNMPAAYLVGLLAGTLAKKRKVKEVVFDIGLQHKKSSRLFAVLKGALDGGLDVKHGASVLPSDERVCGAHMSEKLIKSVETVKDNIINGKVAKVSKKSAQASKKAKPVKSTKKNQAPKKKITKPKK